MIPPLPFDLGPAAMAWVALVCAAAGFVRGYSGFGFAALIVTGAGLVSDPMRFVAVVILADLVLTAQQARGLRGQVDWRRVAGLFAGCLVGVPLSVWGLAAVGVDAARAAISVWGLAMCLLLAAGWRLRARGDGVNLGVGLVSGLANGAAVGGLPVAAAFAAQGVAPAAFRATLIAYFCALDLWTLPVMAQAGLVSRDTVLATLWLLPAMSLGVWAGGRRFIATPPEDFRRFAILLMAGLAVAGLLRSVTWGALPPAPPPPLAPPARAQEGP
ncbi:MAG TPA: sulfite exporter TauE/SafE family protein [Paracoccaceae bacterium]|nr:sulfite exporter TauE/SafE family protein [Paracoccaceae bacterium]